ncbi:MAG: tRNA (N(6)-L-threonylcarbamoyladenosine(37)-C(2))-methylthiotransferase MtaB [Chlorobiaceae bacterium]|nr:tRNA (N(6)-L-threonylcarbamoyladenosine(37)-C(2))-methylthiotransferase MtaB [Chlorobiaceae bacterium]
MNINTKTVAAVTLGCKLNYAETSSILDKLSKQGWQISSIEDGAELIIIHTCAVTKQAEQKCRQKIRRIIRKNPSSRIAVIGCYSQLNSEILARIEGVDAILGNNEKYNLEWYHVTGEHISVEPLVKVSPACTFKDIHEGYSLYSEESKERTRAFLKIQDGCDFGCSYCTIPAARGKSRSLSDAQIVEQACNLSRRGYREIVITGVNIGDYRYNGKVFSDLLRLLENVDVSRLRISSIEPDFLDDTMISLVGNSEKIVPHFHIPLQSGSNAILQAMQRRYDTDLYREKIYKAVERITDCAIGTDVMVGYPGETEADFLEMYRFVEELPVAYLHIFSCSVRPGTLLAKQVATRERTAVHPDEIARRYREIARLGKEKETIFNSRYVGRVMDVLFEECREAGNGAFEYSGYTRNYLRVAVESTTNISGREAPVLIEHSGEDLILKGRLLS